MLKNITQLAIELSHALQKKEWKLATAESCTGGGLSYWITSIPGSSNWFERGFITYSNLAKEELLNVSANTLQTFGSVSQQTACEMALGALQHSQAQISISITGIAGPDGGSTAKPIGTVWMACASISHNPLAFDYLFSGNRQSVRDQSIAAAFEILLRFL